MTRMGQSERATSTPKAAELCRVCLGEGEIYSLGYGRPYLCERCYGTGEEPSEAVLDRRATEVKR